MCGEHRPRAAATMAFALLMVMQAIVPAAVAQTTSTTAPAVFETAVAAPFRVDYGTRYAPRGSSLRLKGFFFASSGEAAMRYDGEFVATWDAAAAIPGRTLTVTVTAAGGTDLSRWQSDFGVRYGLRYRIDADVGAYHIDREDYVPHTPHLDLSWPADTTFTAYALTSDVIVATKEAGSRGECVAPDDGFGDIPTGCVTADALDFEPGFDLCIPEQYPGTAGGQVTDDEQMSIEVTVRPQPPIALDLEAAFGLCLLLNAGAQRLWDTDTGQELVDDGDSFTFQVTIPCEYAAAAPGGSREYTFSRGPFDLETDVSLGFVARVNPVLAACFFELFEISVDPNIGACFRLPVTVPLADIDFPDLMADFTIGIVDPEVRDIRPSGGAVAVAIGDSLTITWDTTWDAPDSCGCRAKVNYRLPPSTVWLPIDPLNPEIENSGSARWLPPVGCVDVQLQVEMLDPQGRHLHTTTGAPFRIDPDPPQLWLAEPPPGLALCPDEMLYVVWGAADPCAGLAANPYRIRLWLPAWNRSVTIASGLPAAQTDFWWHVPGFIPMDPGLGVVVEARDAAGNWSSVFREVDINQPLDVAMPQGVQRTVTGPSFFDVVVSEVSDMALPPCGDGQYLVEFSHVWGGEEAAVEFHPDWEGEPRTLPGEYPAELIEPGTELTYSFAMTSLPAATGLRIAQVDTFIARVYSPVPPLVWRADTLLILPDSSLSSVGPLPAAAAAQPRLWAAPSPLNPRTRIFYDVLEDGMVRVDVYDLRGRPVAALLRSWQPAGQYTVTWNGRGTGGRALPSGVYIVRLLAAGRIASCKVVLLE